MLKVAKEVKKMKKEMLVRKIRIFSDGELCDQEIESLLAVMDEVIEDGFITTVGIDGTHTFFEQSTNLCDDLVRDGNFIIVLSWDGCNLFFGNDIIN